MNQLIKQRGIANKATMKTKWNHNTQCGKRQKKRRERALKCWEL